MKNPIKRDMEMFQYIFLVSGYEMMELFNSAILVILGVAYLNPQSDSFSNGKAYDIIKLLFNEPGFGAFLLFAGLISYFAIRSTDLRFRAVAAGLQAVIWTLIFSSLFNANGSVAVPFLFFVFAVFSGVIFGRLIKTYLNNIGRL